MKKSNNKNDQSKDLFANQKQAHLKNKVVALLGKYYTIICVLSGIFIVMTLTWFIASRGLSNFTGGKVKGVDFLFGTQWNPNSDPPLYGAFPFIAGSFLITILAVVVSTPLSCSLAVFMSEINPKWGRNLLQPVIELLVGIPSVVYGFIGLTVIVPFIRNTLGGIGFSLISGMIVLGIMIIPTITSVSYDAVHVLPDSYKDASYALGATRWQTIYRILIPTAFPGMLTGVVLGMARAFGEALAVQMVIGNVKTLPASLLDPMTTLTSILTLEITNTVPGTTYNNALWSMAFILLLMSFIFILLIRLLGRRK